MSYLSKAPLKLSLTSVLTYYSAWTLLFFCGIELHSKWYNNLNTNIELDATALPLPVVLVCNMHHSTQQKGHRFPSKFSFWPGKKQSKLFCDVTQNEKKNSNTKGSSTTQYYRSNSTPCEYNEIKNRRYVLTFQLAHC